MWIFTACWETIENKLVLHLLGVQLSVPWERYFASTMMCPCNYVWRAHVYWEQMMFSSYDIRLYTSGYKVLVRAPWKLLQFYSIPFSNVLVHCKLANDFAIWRQLALINSWRGSQPHRLWAEGKWQCCYSTTLVMYVWISLLQFLALLLGSFLHSSVNDICRMGQSHTPMCIPMWDK